MAIQACRSCHRVGSRLPGPVRESIAIAIYCQVNHVVAQIFKGPINIGSTFRCDKAVESLIDGADAEKFIGWLPGGRKQHTEGKSVAVFEDGINL